MHTAKTLKIVLIGNSKGVRLPKSVLKKYRFGESVILEEREEGIMLRNENSMQLTWEETYRSMAQTEEDWSDFGTLLLDGITTDEEHD